MNGYVRKICKKCRSLFGRRQNSSFNNANFWKMRSKKYGKRAVINTKHSETQFEDITKRDKDETFPYLSKLLHGDEKLVLDFGCGSGRFTKGLAELINGKAIGIDPTRELLELAPESDDVDYKVMQEGAIPLSDNSVDVLCMYLVIGCIKGDSLRKTVAEINRVLKSDGLLFLVENTSDNPSRDFYSFRKANDYMDMFSFVSLKHLHDYFDEGTNDKGKKFSERYSIMAGRKKVVDKTI